jgi:predicted dehydrogenase
VTIHYIDLLNYHFGNIKSKFYTPKLVSKNGSSFDSCHLLLSFENGITASIFNSYASPVVNEISVIGTNGVLNIRNNELSIRSPRDTFNSEGFFEMPPITHREKFHIEDGYMNSLKNSMNYFLNCVSKKLDIDKNHFESSLSTNQLIFDIENMPIS